MLRIFVILVATLTASSAVAKCRYNNDPLKNCEDALSDWWNDNSSHQSQSGDDIQHRTSSLRGTLQECKDCAMDRVESGADQAAPSTDTSTSTNNPN
jgi:hypothetical protein